MNKLYLYSSCLALASMSRINFYPSDAEQGSQAVNPSPAAEAPKKDAFDASATKYFGPDKVGEASEYASKIAAYCESKQIPWFKNFDPSAELPAGFGILIQPVQKRDKAKQELVLTDIVIASVPDIAAIESNEKGAHYLREILREAFGRRLKQAVVSAKKTKSTVSLPDTLEGFIEAIRARSPLYTFNQLQERVRKSLDKKGIKVSKEMLQGVLMSASFAEQVFPNQKQAQWILVIDRMIQVAKSENLDPSILDAWKTDRANASFSHDDSIDLGDLEL